VVVGALVFECSPGSINMKICPSAMGADGDGTHYKKLTFKKRVELWRVEFLVFFT
jgi:hypothetical protein